MGVAEDAPTLLATAAEHSPDVVVTDIKMPPSFQLEGIDCAHSIRDRHPDTGVVVLSAHDDEEYAIALLGKGHSGLAYLLKDRIAQGDELARAIREVQSGGSVVDPTIAERLSGRAESQEEDRIVLDMMAQGLGYEAMAAALGTTQEAVDGRVTMLFRRMAGDGGAGTGLLGEFKRAARRGRRAVGDRHVAQVLRAVAVRGRARSRRGRREPARARGDRPVQRHPRVLDDRRATHGSGDRRDRRTSPRRDGRGDLRARRHDRQVPRRRGDGRLRRTGAVRGSRGACVADARWRCRIASASSTRWAGGQKRSTDSTWGSG